MSFMEGLQNILSLPHKNEYVVIDQENKQHIVRAISPQDALHVASDQDRNVDRLRSKVVKKFK